MKKIFAILLIACLIWTIGITALASEHIGQVGSKEIEVTANYASTNSTPVVYSVDIDWSNMNFTYTRRNINIWNAGNHSYSLVSDGGWDNTSANITVTNHSNVAVRVKMVYKAQGNTGIKAALTNGTAELAAGEEGNYNGADSVTATLTVSGTPNGAIASEAVKIGTIKVTIN